MADAGPLVTIVVITYERGPAVTRCIRGLFEQTHRPLEVVVVDDGSTDGTASAVGDVVATAPADVPVRLCRHDANRGVGAARNTGIDAARGTYVAFTDDDAEPDPTWIERLVGRLEEDDRIAVAGGSIHDPEAATWAQQAACGMHFLRDDAGPVRSIVGGNMVFRATFLADHRFDPGCRYGADELDLCFTAGRLGHTVWFDPAAVVVHHHRRTVGGYLRQQWKRGQGSVWVRAKHRRGLWPRKHWVTLVMLLSPVAFAFLPPVWAALLCVTTVGLFLVQTLALDLSRRKPLAQALHTLPLVALGYLFEFAGALRGVLRFRGGGVGARR